MVAQKPEVEAVVFGEEPWSEVGPEIRAIAGRHWSEIAVHQDKFELDLDGDLYDKLEALDILHITTARSGSRLVGYYVSIIKTHPHYRNTLFGFLDSYFILPEFRCGTVGVELFDAMESAMKRRGVRCLLSGMKSHHDIEPLFRRLGWTSIETAFTKFIG